MQFPSLQPLTRILLHIGEQSRACVFASCGDRTGVLFMMPLDFNR